MLKIHLQLYSILREKLPPASKGRTVLELSEGAVLADLLDELDIKRKVVISVNDIQENDKSLQADVLSDIAVVQFDSGRFENSIEYLKKALDLKKSLNDKEIKCTILKK